MGRSKSSADFVQRSRLLEGEGQGNIWKENKGSFGGRGGGKKAIFGQVHQAGVAGPGAPCVQIWFCGPDRRWGSALQLLPCGGCKSNRGTEALGRLPPGAKAHHTKMLRRAARTWEDETERQMLFVLLILTARRSGGEREHVSQFSFHLSTCPQSGSPASIPKRSDYVRNVAAAPSPHIHSPHVLFQLFEAPPGLYVLKGLDSFSCLLLLLSPGCPIIYLFWCILRFNWSHSGASACM